MTILGFDIPQIDHPALRTFAGLAHGYCEAVDAFETMAPVDFIRRLQAIVPTLYAAGLALPSAHLLSGAEDEGDDDDDEIEYVPSPPNPDAFGGPARDALMARLEAYLGERNFYREVFDPWEPIEERPEVTGSIALDVTDMYGDLQCGLKKWARDETGAALWEWRFGLENHWGQHATAVIRALHCAAAWHHTGWPKAQDSDLGTPNGGDVI